jgi:acetyl/propionyl-CoA carboxylase alpha subunit
MQQRFQSGDEIYSVSIERSGSRGQAVIDGISYDVEILDEQPGQLSILFNGRPTIIHWAVDGEQKWISLEGCTYVLEKPSPRLVQRQVDTGSGDILRAPMPSQVRLLQASVGDWLEKGQSLMVLEAMKMEIRIQAPHPGRLIRLLVGEGQTVDRNQVLAEMRPETP